MCLVGVKCQFAHGKEELRELIGNYHFNNIVDMNGYTSKIYQPLENPLD